MTLTKYDRPNSYIGSRVPRPNITRLMAGRGKYIDDKSLPRMLHVVFVRSPFAHARIVSIDATAALAVEGVASVLTGRDIVDVVSPWVGVLTHLSGMRSPPQPCVATDTARWQGEPVAMVLASSRAIAEDAATLVDVDYDPLDAVCDMEEALEPRSPLIHPGYDSNLCWERKVEAGDVDAAFADPANTVVERSFDFGRHTGVTLEPRGCVCEYDPAEDRMTMHYSGQAPHMIQVVLAKHLGIPEGRVRVISDDVGGSFGIKVHTYGDEIAVAGAAKLLKRPVKFAADRLESFQSDIHAREHRVRVKAAINGEGLLQALDVDDITGIGPYSVYPRSSGIEGNQVINLTGAPYRIPAYRGRLRVVFQNKVPTCQYRAVGHPIAMAIMEGVMDELAKATGCDPAELRRINLVPDDAYPHVSAQGMKFADLSHQKCLAKLLDLMDYEALKQERDRLRGRGVYRGIGIVSMVEVTNPSPMFYGVGGAPIAAQDGASARLDASGALHVASSITEQGQGTDAMLAQIAADGFGVDLDMVHVKTGDTAVVPYGGGTWASRGAGIGGEAMLQACKALKAQVLEAAAAVLQAKPGALDIFRGAVTDLDGTERMTLADLARMVYYRGNELPAGLSPEFIATRHYKVSDVPFVFTNGAMASYVEVDTDTGIVKLLKHWVVEDVGTIINEQLVDEQIRGGVVQGIGGALYEECVYSDDGQLLNASMADYLVPMSVEMPDIEIAHVMTPTSTSELGAKGAGEAGTAGAPGAIMNAVNDALAPLGCSISKMPMSPERILRALGTVD
ncbi:xanthine dehydrogenase family protein molybdopterin-binding subunit [Aquamicrobium sp. LC103]|uniref:xanthine dehydrogenase family protein molybdopterin-binding subunit n=1 Tax=Aquamicrobium sp. LC103 TaxID=1120658 RepID=UPI00063ECF49|nr:xanthine dehydrogenase family protein molybdopterin-binding subunit [Aquamicrobium sp. LC103]TKT69234.1 xanthine dehydrogenase family protein [Aquamicrobium sp. LC103]